MAANSMRKMVAEKVIKRADSEKIELHNIFFEDGFNPPGRNDECEEEDEQLYQHIMQYGISQLPQLAVRPRDAGGVYVVDGHRRTLQIRRAVADGLDLIDPKDGKIWIPIKQFVGNDEDRLFFVVESNRHKGLKPAQIAHVCKEARALGRSNDQIAKRLKLSKTTIDNYLTIADADAAIQAMIQSGDVSMTNAVHVVRAEGENAAPVLAASIKAAKESGKTKATAKTLPRRTGPTKRDIDVAEAVRAAVLDICRDTVSGSAYDAALDMDLAEVITKGVK